MYFGKIQDREVRLQGETFYLFRTHSEPQIIIFFQQTNSSETDARQWKAQRGDLTIFSHGSHHSAGVAVFFSKFKGDVAVTRTSQEGRRLTVVFQIDNATFTVCNLYEYNKKQQQK